MGRTVVDVAHSPQFAKLFIGEWKCHGSNLSGLRLELIVEVGEDKAWCKN